jgi:hypothetical protein
MLKFRQMDIICNVKTSWFYGIGIEIGISPSQIKSVTGTVLTENYITVTTYGTKQIKACVIILILQNSFLKSTISKFTNLPH